MLKNPNYEVFKLSFAKTKPDLLARCNLGDLMEQDTERKRLLPVLNVYLTGRQMSVQNQEKDIATLFKTEEQISFFTQHYTFWLQRSQIRG